MPLRRSWGTLDKSLNPPVPTVLNRCRRVLTVSTSPQGSSEDSNSDCTPKGSAHGLMQSAQRFKLLGVGLTLLPGSKSFQVVVQGH